MKKLMTALAIASLSTAALAKPLHNVSPQAAAAQASVPSQDYSTSDPNIVVVDGTIVGRDPSPDIRANLRRDQVVLVAQ